uniref:Uncharacterized protein n=1 Tax=Marseillevirus LCMAC202 TaxID=2506606 RepID=A0A481YY88_9VIRU|nr:MAG: hypothetical protein LCMAC202_05740 [Marseillevirus LCMAC202]
MPAKCPPGKIRRKAYTRKDGTYVKSTCVPDVGQPGKTPARKKVLPVPVKGNLSKYGYFDVKNTTPKVRRAALLKAVKAAGYATIVRRVNLIANYNKLSKPEVHEIMRSDMDWMKENLFSKYSKSSLRASKRVSRKGSKKRSRKGSKKRSRKGSKKRSRKVSKKRSRKASKKRSRKVSKKRSRKASKKHSRKVSKKRSRKASKKRSRKVSKKRSRKVTKTGAKVKVGTTLVGGRNRQLYRMVGSTKTFYQYRKKEGGMGRRYLVGVWKEHN